MIQLSEGTGTRPPFQICGNLHTTVSGLLDGIGYTISNRLKKYEISKAAVSGESEP